MHMTHRKDPVNTGGGGVAVLVVAMLIIRSITDLEMPKSSNHLIFMYFSKIYSAKNP